MVVEFVINLKTKIYVFPSTKFQISSIINLRFTYNFPPNQSISLENLECIENNENLVIIYFVNYIYLNLVNTYHALKLDHENLEYPIMTEDSENFVTPKVFVKMSPSSSVIEIWEGANNSRISSHMKWWWGSVCFVCP